MYLNSLAIYVISLPKRSKITIDVFESRTLISCVEGIISSKITIDVFE